MVPWTQFCAADPKGHLPGEQTRHGHLQEEPTDHGRPQEGGQAQDLLLVDKGASLETKRERGECSIQNPEIMLAAV